MDVIVNFARTPYPSLCYIYLYNGLIQIRDILLKEKCLFFEKIYNKI